MPSHYTRIVLNERPVASIVDSTFRSERAPFDLKPGKDQVLIKVTWLELVPAMRGWLNDARSYMPPVKLGETMRSAALGVVVEVGPGSNLKVGDAVSGTLGWTEFAIAKTKDVQKLLITPGIQPLDYLNTLGASGMTAYFGLKEVCDVKPGETLVVSGAAGSVGSIVCQLGKRLGAKVIAIAGNDDKCEWLEKELGVDKALNYKSPSFRKDFREIGYLDAFFDNVGGEILDLALTRLQKGARIALCGAISAYNTKQNPGLKNYLTLISQRAKIEGFIVFDYIKRYPEAVEELSKGLADGSIKRKFHIIEGGIAQAPKALPLLFSGGNTGKLVVRVQAETARL